MAAIDVVKAFLSSWGSTKDEVRGAIRDYFTDETLWENVGLATTVGIEQALGLMDQLEQSAGITAIRAETLFIAETGDAVLTERIDYTLDAAGEVVAGLRLMGIFEVENGKVVRWRDYCDPAAIAAMGSAPA